MSTQLSDVPSYPPQAFSGHRDLGSLDLPELWQATVARIMSLNTFRDLVTTVAALSILIVAVYFVALLTLRCVSRREKRWLAMVKIRSMEVCPDTGARPHRPSILLGPLRRSSSNKSVRWADDILELNDDAGDIGAMGNNTYILTEERGGSW